MTMQIRLIKQGFILILITLIAALFIPIVALPRLALSAHTIGAMGGILLILVGVIWHKLQLSRWQQSIVFISWWVSSYANWAACLVGAVTGAGSMTPLATPGASGHVVAEMLVSVLLMSVVLTSFVAVGFTIWGLHPFRHSRGVTNS